MLYCSWNIEHFYLFAYLVLLSKFLTDGARFGSWMKHEYAVRMLYFVRNNYVAVSG